MKTMLLALIFLTSCGSDDSESNADALPELNLFGKTLKEDGVELKFGEGIFGEETDFELKMHIETEYGESKYECPGRAVIEIDKFTLSGLEGICNVFNGTFNYTLVCTKRHESGECITMGHSRSGTQK